MLSCGRVIDELKDLWEQSVQTRGAEDNSVFNICLAILWSSQDCKACLTCNKDTASIRVIGKEAYIGHRRLLCRLQLLRNNRKIDGKIERCQPPQCISITEILDKLNHVRPQ